MSFYQWVKWPLFLLSAEMAHNVALKALQWNLVPAQPKSELPILKNTVWSLEFASPIGLAAGFDKNAQALSSLAQQGFGFIEVGTVTPKPQIGNPKPRLFRLTQDNAIINRMGFNNKGADFFVERMQQRPRNIIIGANIGKNKTTEDAIEDYIVMLKKVYGLSTYIVINISSPNTPGLRSLQKAEILQSFLKSLLSAKKELVQSHVKDIPILLKIDPDGTAKDYQEMGAVFLQEGIEGLIVSNTTIKRPDYLTSVHRKEMGGLSGKPLLEQSTEALKQVYRATQGKIPIIGVGGVASGEDAYTKIKAGATLVQLYSSLIYQGFDSVGRMHQELAQLLQRDGFNNIKEAIGKDVKL